LVSVVVAEWPDEDIADDGGIGMFDVVDVFAAASAVVGLAVEVLVDVLELSLGLVDVDGGGRVMVDFVDVFAAASAGVGIDVEVLEGVDLAVNDDGCFGIVTWVVVGRMAVSDFAISSDVVGNGDDGVTGDGVFSCCSLDRVVADSSGVIEGTEDDFPVLVDCLAADCRYASSEASMVGVKRLGYEGDDDTWF